MTNLVYSDLDFSFVCTFCANQFMKSTHDAHHTHTLIIMTTTCSQYHSFVASVHHKSKLLSNVNLVYTKIYGKSHKHHHQEYIICIYTIKSINAHLKKFMRFIPSSWVCVWWCDGGVYLNVIPYSGGAMTKFTNILVKEVMMMAHGKKNGNHFQIWFLPLHFLIL